MPETKRKPKVVPAPEKQDLTNSEVEEILIPELSQDTFTIGERTFAIRVLPYKFEQMFRRHAIPILEMEMKPVEKAIINFATDQVKYTNDLKITESLLKSEVDADQYLTNAVICICLSQDERWLKAAQKGVELPLEQRTKIETEYRVLIDMSTDYPTESPRHYLREVVRKQADKMKLSQRLGESLMARLAEVSSLMGSEAREKFDSQKQDFMQQVLTFMEKAGKRVEASVSSSTPSMGTGSGTNRTEEHWKSGKLNLTEKADHKDSEAVPVGEQAEVATA